MALAPPMAITVAITNTASVGKAAAHSIASAPPAIIHAATRMIGWPERSTHGTSHNDSSKPMLPAAAISDFGVGPASKALTAISSRKVVLAVSMTPWGMARSRS
ncbi:MAG: hypothetical protein KatS3mg052_0761 [Candidatus Roseilinea sp.]|nr:MAG: hypothetical protein KatS3mg052_0761 [Candidatus Roseilinea sp.]